MVFTKKAYYNLKPLNNLMSLVNYLTYLKMSGLYCNTHNY